MLAVGLEDGGRNAAAMYRYIHLKTSSPSAVSRHLERPSFPLSQTWLCWELRAPRSNQATVHIQVSSEVLLPPQGTGVREESTCHVVSTSDIRPLGQT